MGVPSTTVVHTADNPMVEDAGVVGQTRNENEKRVSKALKLVALFATSFSRKKSKGERCSHFVCNNLQERSPPIRTHARLRLTIVAWSPRNEPPRTSPTEITIIQEAGIGSSLTHARMCMRIKETKNVASIATLSGSLLRLICCCGGGS